MQTLEQVLTRLEKAGLRVKRSKCHFMEYLGYRIDGSGLHPLPEKVEAIKDAPVPKSVTELKSYLGLLTYYKFLPNMSSVLAPLYQLLQKNSRWCWTEAEQTAFDQSRNWLTSSNLLVHFDPKLPLTLASPYGVGAVLAHKMSDGTERPIGYASRSLTSAERNYSQLEKEGLACIFGVKRFQSYLFGHPFELVTDHKPLLALLNDITASFCENSKMVSVLVWLRVYFEISKYRQTQMHSADCHCTFRNQQVVPNQSWSF